MMFLAWSIAGCVTRSNTDIALEPGATLSQYRDIEVQVTNDTQQTYSFDIASFFADELKTALRAKGYEIVERGTAAGQVLILKCSIVAYSPDTAGKRALATAIGSMPGVMMLAPKDTATIKATLIDQQSGKILADILSYRKMPSDGVVPNINVHVGCGDVSLTSSEKMLLRNAACSFATKIDKKIKES